MWVTVGKKSAKYLKTPMRFLKENGITDYDLVPITCDVPTLLNEHRYQTAADAHGRKFVDCVPPWVQFQIALKNKNNGICYYIYHFSNSHINSTSVERDTKNRLKGFVEKNHLKAYVFKEGWLYRDMSTVIICRQSDSVFGLETEPDWYFEQSVENNSENMKEQQKMNQKSKEFVENDPKVLKTKIACKLSEVSQMHRFVAACHFKNIAKIAVEYSELSEQKRITTEEIKKIEDEIEAIKTSMKLSETFERMSKGVNP